MTIRITSDFTGHPGAPDDQTERHFRTGEEPADLDEAYADLLVAKGLAERVAAEPVALAEPAADAEIPAEPDAAPRSRRTPR